MKIGKLTLLLLALLSWLNYSFFLGKNGLRDYIRVNQDINTQQSINVNLKARNSLLFAEINDLNESNEAIEERARYELGMIKLGETFYRLVPGQSKNHTISPLSTTICNNST